MNKILRYSLIAVLAFISNIAFADNVVTFTAGTEKGQYTGSGTPQSGKESITKEGVTIGTSNGAFAAINTSTKANEYRIYKSSTFTATVAKGTIKKIVFTCTAKGTAKQGPGCFTGEGYTFEDSGEQGTWEGNAASVTLTASSNQVRATKIEVTIDPDGQGGGDTPTPSPTVVDNIAAFKAIGAGNKAILTLKDAQVQYVNGTNDMYIVDATGGIDIYKSELKYTAGQILNGTIEGTYDEFNKLPEITSITKSDITVTDGTVSPVEMTVEEANKAENVCKLVTVKNITLVKVTEGKYTNYYTDENKTFQIYDKFKLGYTPNTESAMDYTGILVPYNSKMELAPTVAPTTTTNISGIRADEAADNAPVYNLSGQRVGKNAKGVLIKNGKKYVVK